MALHQETLEVRTRSPGLSNVTAEVSAVVARSGITTGLCTVFVQHTSASLVIQENADPAVLRERLTGRGTEDPAEQARRLETARVELAAQDEFDYRVVNTDVGAAAREVVELMAVSSHRL